MPIMKSRRVLTLAFGTFLFIALSHSPTAVFAQTAISPTTSGAGTGGGGGGGAGTGTGTSASNGTTISAPTQSISSGAGSTTTIPSNSNPFASSFVNPQSVGQPTKYQTVFGALKPTGTFGKGLYITTASTSTGGASSIAATQATGFSTLGIPRSPQYTTVLSEDVPFVFHSSDALYADVRSVLDQASFLANRGNVQVTVQNGIVMLTGQVASAKEFRMVEAQVRFTPGVRGVLNELKIAPSK
jgi:hypothetical protein